MPLTGAPMVSALVDNYLVGEPVSAPAFMMRFSPGGEVTFVNDRAGRIRGSWQIVGPRVCIQWTDAPLPACQQPWLDGDRLTFTDAAGRTIAVARLRHEPPDWAAGLLD